MWVPMSKVAIVTHRRKLDTALATLQGLAMVHVADAAELPRLAGRSYVPSAEERAELADLRYLLLRLDALLELVDEVPLDDTDPGPVDRAELRCQVDATAADVEELTQRVDALTAERDALPRHVAALRRLLPLVQELPELERWETVALIIERTSAHVIELLRDALRSAAGDRFEIVSAPVDETTLGVVVVFPREASASVHALLGREQVGTVRLPADFEGMPFRAAVIAMIERLAVLPDDIAEAVKERARRVRACAPWRHERQRIVARIERLELLSRLGATEGTAVVVGWIPEKRRGEVERALALETDDESMLIELAPEEAERPPVLLSNPRPARPFELLVGMLDLPRYGTVDPTLLMSIFMPLFFGMMLGDVAHGLIALALSLYVGRRFGRERPVVAALSRILAIGSGWAVVWGVVFGELFGDLGRRMFHMEPLWMNREEAIAPLLLFAVAVGAAHVLLGLLLGMWNAVRIRDRSLLLERVGGIAALSGLFLLAGLAAGKLPPAFTTPGVAALVIGVVIFARRHGASGILLGPLEVVSLAGGVLSYLRLAAIGMASAYLSRVANELAVLGPLWLGLTIAALFHALNLALGVFSPSIQALRLHYVEFFGKFFEPGGEAFRPFGGRES